MCMWGEGDGSTDTEALLLPSGDQGNPGILLARVIECFRTEVPSTPLLGYNCTTAVRPFSLDEAGLTSLSQLSLASDL